MTYIKPNCNKNILNRILAGLVCGILMATFYLVAVYNDVVNLNHNIAAAKAQLDAIGAQNTTLNNQVVASLGNIQSGDLAAEGGLVQDNHPQYFSQSWPIASKQ